MPSTNWARPIRDSAGVYTWRATTTATDVGLGGGVTTDLITRARAGDGEAFRELTEPYRRELQV